MEPEASHSAVAPADRSWGAILKRTVADFWANDSLSMAAALAYSTVFSLPGLLIVLLTVVGLFVDAERAQEVLRNQLGGVVGPGGREQIEAILENAQRPDMGRGVASLLGTIFLVIGATGAMVQLQNFLNRTWDVKPDPNQGGIRNFITKRILSFGLILGIAFLLVVSLVISAVLSAIGAYLGALLPGVGAWALELLNNAVSFLVIAGLFATMFKFLPDAEISWRDVRVGAVATTLLFVLGKFLIGLYLGRSEPGEPFGAAASLAILLVWVYYASLIVLLGAEFTQSWATARGGGIRPEAGAVRVEGGRG